MGGFFGLTPVGLASGPAEPAPVIFDGGGSVPQDTQPSTLASIGTLFHTIGQTVASTYQAFNAPGVTVPPTSGGTPAPGAQGTFGGGFGKLLLYAAIAFAAVFIGIKLFERR